MKTLLAPSCGAVNHCIAKDVAVKQHVVTDDITMKFYHALGVRCETIATSQVGCCSEVAKVSGTRTQNPQVAE